MAETVLVVDDNPVNVALLERILRHQRYRVLGAHHAAAALEAIEAHRPDVILLDVQMPGMDGLDLTRQLKANAKTVRIPVLLVTGYAAAEDRELAHLAGADDIVSKPINPAELLTRVRVLLSLRQAGLELEAAEAAMLRLARCIEERTPFKRGHGDRLARHTRQLADRLGWAPEEREAVVRAAAVHDIGHIGVPEALLLKRGSLTAAEMERVRRHPALGEELCAPLRMFSASLPIIRHHHERMDGSGYPDGLRGEAIPRGARLLSLADAYDALTTARPFRPAQTRAAALSQLKSEVDRGWWDAGIFEVLRSAGE